MLLGFCLPELLLVQSDIVDIVGNDELLGFCLPELWLVQSDIVDIVGNDELLGFCLPELWLVQPDVVDIIGNDELLGSHLIVKVPEILSVQDPRPELNEGLHVGQQAVQ